MRTSILSAAVAVKSPGQKPGEKIGRIVRSKPIGGMLNHYYREAA
jgi:hypothetical protein